MMDGIYGLATANSEFYWHIQYVCISSFET